MESPSTRKPSPSAVAGLLLSAIGLAALLPAPARAADGGTVAPVAGLSIKVLNSRSPPGGALQFIVTLTEPKPILMGFTTLTSTTGTLMGVALGSPGPGVSDAFGTAVYRGGQVVLRAASPSALLGAAPGVPFVTLTLGVSPLTPLGTVGTFAVDPAASQWLDPTGQPYPQVVRNGRFEIAGTVSITNVFPGGGLVPAGATVVVSGVGFQPGAIVEIDGVRIASTTFVSAAEIDVTLGVAADLSARNVIVRNPDFTGAKYYSYLRGLWLAPTANALLASTDPIFSQQTFRSASFATAPAAGRFFGVALQNASAAAADVVVELRDPALGLLASAALTLPPWNRIWRDATELFGAPAPPSGFLVVRSATPLQVLGVVGDAAAGTVVPQVPALAFP